MFPLESIVLVHLRHLRVLQRALPESLNRFLVQQDTIAIDAQHEGLWRSFRYRVPRCVDSVHGSLYRLRPRSRRTIQKTSDPFAHRPDAALRKPVGLVMITRASSRVNVPRCRPPTKHVRVPSACVVCAQ